MEKTYKLFLADSVFSDLESMNSKAISNVLKKTELLETFPELGFAITGKNKWNGYRELIVEGYKVLYTLDNVNKAVYVRFVKHGKMNFQ